MAKKIERKCRTCRWYGAPEKPYHLHRYPCRWPMPDDFTFPASISPKAWNSPIQQLAKSIKGYMRPGEGKECPRWEALDASAARPPE